MRGWTVLIALTFGCSEPEPKPTPYTGVPGGDPTVPTGLPTGSTTGATTPTYDPACADRVVATWPDDGRGDVYYRTSIEFTLNDLAQPTDQLVLSRGATQLPGTTEAQGRKLLFHPDDPLDPTATYHVGLADCPPSTISFTTSATGNPVDVSRLVGTAYAVDLSSGRWIEPAGAGTLLGATLTVDILVGVLAADATEVTVLGGVSEEYAGQTQDMCAETVEFPAADFTANPYFEIGPQDLYLTVQGATVDLRDVHISGSFRANMDAIDGATLTGTLDTRTLVSALYPGGGPGSVCALLLPMGVACVPCPDGSGNFCVDAVVDDLSANAIVGTLVPRTATDIALDPTCP